MMCCQVVNPFLKGALCFGSQLFLRYSRSLIGPSYSSGPNSG